MLPASHRAEWPTKPCPSVPDIPERATPLGDGAVVVTVVVDVVADGMDVDCADIDGVGASVDDGAASAVCGCDAPVWSPLKTTTTARAAAIAKNTIVPTASPTWALPNRDFPGGAAGTGNGA